MKNNKRKLIVMAAMLLLCISLQAQDQSIGVLQVRRIDVGLGSTITPLKFANGIANRRLVLWESADNDQQYFGFGINNGMLRYQVDATTADHVFYAGSGTSTSSELMRIKGNGNVGIGTATPQDKLDIAAPAVGSPDFTRVATISRSKSDNDYHLSSYTGEGTLDSGPGTVTNAFGVGYGGFPMSEGFRFIRGNIATDGELAIMTALNERINIKSNGNVGIGTTIPTALLSVNGTANKPGGGSWATFSDQRVKKNINDYTKGLREILAIHPVTFEYNGIGFGVDGKIYVGVVAQEIEKVLPSTVTTVKYKEFNDLRQYDSSELTYTLINAVKELKAEVDSLKLQLKDKK